MCLNVIICKLLQIVLEVVGKVAGLRQEDLTNGTKDSRTKIKKQKEKRKTRQ